MPASNYPFPPRLIFFVALKPRAAKDSTQTTVRDVEADPLAVLNNVLRLFYPGAQIEVSPGAGLVIDGQGVAAYGPPYVAPDWKQDGDHRTMYIDRLVQIVYDAGPDDNQKGETHDEAIYAG